MSDDIMGKLVFAETGNATIFTFHADGTVEFAEHLTPKEGSEEAWRLLKEIVDQHNSKILGGK